jgi:phage replication O-like protein O
VGPQIEKGFLQIASGNKENDILSALLNAGLNGSEWDVVIFVIRKTYGFKKIWDKISLTQFVNAGTHTKQSYINAIKSLVVKKIILVKKTRLGKVPINTYSFNKQINIWKVVKKIRLVKKNSQGSQKNLMQVVKKTLHTKDTLTKETITKDNKTSDKPKSKQKKFVKPTPEEVVSYAKSINFTLDGAQFCDHYEARGWMIGKNKMKNWQAAVRTWKRNQKEQPISNTPKLLKGKMTVRNPITGEVEEVTAI